MAEHIDFSIIMPALNEEKDIEAAIFNSLRAIDHVGISGEIIVINDGSTARTEAVVKGVCSLRRKTVPCC
jgi:glycosyltransferase involved in cell wall biosynthesis